MRFLKMLFWIIVAVVVTLFAARNWRDVTIGLWSNLQLDIKIPVLLATMFVIGFLPTWLIYRARLWRLENRVGMPQLEPRRSDERETGPGE